MVRVDAIIERYADALFQAALAEEAIQAVLSDCQRLSSALTTDKAVSRVLANRSISQEQFLTIFAELQKALELHKVTGRFLRVVAEKGRQNLLAGILGALKDKAFQYQNKSNVQVTSALPLQQSQRCRLISVLEQRMDTEVILQEKVDEALIGGLVIRIGSFEIDSSIRTKLSRVQQSLESLK